MDNETESVVIRKDEIQAMSSAFNTERVRAQVAEEKVAKEAFTTKVVGSSGETTQNREIQAPAEEVAERVVPMLENGQPDFNSMDTDMFVEEYASRYGKENTAMLARKNIASARESIKKIDK